jgi:hypothetical protein
MASLDLYPLTVAHSHRKSGHLVELFQRSKSLSYRGRLSGITLTSSCMFMSIGSTDRVLQPLAPENLGIAIPQRKYGTQGPQGGQLY